MMVECTFAGGDQRKSRTNQTASGAAEHALGARAGAVGPPPRVNASHQVFVRRTGPGRYGVGEAEAGSLLRARRVRNGSAASRAKPGGWLGWPRALNTSSRRRAVKRTAHAGPGRHSETYSSQSASSALQIKRWRLLV